MLTATASALEDFPLHASRNCTCSRMKRVLLVSPSAGTPQERDDLAVFDFDDSTTPGTLHSSSEPDRHRVFLPNLLYCVMNLCPITRVIAWGWAITFGV